MKEKELLIKHGSVEGEGSGGTVSQRKEGVALASGCS